ncbi:endospore germination permease [Geomicrobium sp. JCM 19038]|uniref:endospore germination permease n=1 Tax=Geomicrobium sp. JCM 19038 TaxID=1460635 RepID=UPI00045F180D|nr:endospore germination permease [Geomicrobium sp. JCM 19038]GAK07732.1 spore germination protein XB [Geomicrobium sp. JCM 19038]
MNIGRLQPIHIYILIIIATGFMVHVLLMPSLLNSAGRDAWLSVLVSLFTMLIIVTVITMIIRTLNGKDLASFLKDHYPAPVAWAILTCFIIVFFAESLISLKFSVDWAKSNYAADAPELIIASGFILLCFYAAYKGSFVLGLIAVILFPIVCSFGILVGVGNMKSKNYDLLFPMFADGYTPMFEGIMYTNSGFLEMIYILFLLSYTKKKLTFKGLFLSGLVIFILILGPLTGSLSAFGIAESLKLNTPAYEQWRLLSLGRYITRLDFLSIFQWFSGLLVRVALFTTLLNQLLPFKKKKISLVIIYIILFILIILPLSHRSFVELMHNVYFPFTFYFLSSALLLLSILVWIKKGGDTHQKSQRRARSN